MEYQDTERSLIQLYQYFLSEKLLKNLEHDLFRYIDVDQNGVVTREEYETTLKQANISLPTAQRAYALAAIDNPSRDLGFGDFEIALELLLDESISTVTFAYLLGTPAHSSTVGIDKQTLVTGMKEIFSRLPDTFPQPGSDQFDYLFNQFDADHDNLLNPEEFFHVLSIFLRYYKAGISNNNYAKLVQRDNVFTLLWENENAEAAFKAQQNMLQEGLEDFFQLAVFSRILNTVAGSIFDLIDVNENGVIELDEFKKGMDLFQAPEAEALLLYTTADTDANGGLDLGEFLIVFESFVRKALSKIAYTIFQTNGEITTVDGCSKLWRGLADKFSVNIGLTDEAFNTLYDEIDADDNLYLDVSEFTQFTSVMVTSIKKSLREQEDLRITVVSSLNATNSTLSEAYEKSITQETFNTNVTAAQGILSRILSRASIAHSAFASSPNEAPGSDNEAENGTADLSDATAFVSIDSGRPLGVELGFSLYDTVKQAVKTNGKDQLQESANQEAKNPLGMSVLLQSQIREFMKI